MAKALSRLIPNTDCRLSFSNSPLTGSKAQSRPARNNRAGSDALPQSSDCDLQRPSRALTALVWNVEPASIQKFKPVIEENQQKIAEGQQAAINADEKKKAHEARQKRGEARAIELVNAFHPISYRGTEHGVMADTKKLLFNYIVKQKARSADMEDVANKVAAHIAAEYEKVERMGVNSR